MRIGLIHKGGALPNVALMRLSSWHKALGDEVILDPVPTDNCQKVYISTIFTWQKKQVEEIAAHFQPTADVEIGGSGWEVVVPGTKLSVGPRLPPEVDAMPHDYSLYNIDYGMGYSSRGCIRHCSFCPVPRLEGGMHEDKTIQSLLNPRSNKLMLLDNNFFASDWKPKIEEIERRGLVVDWPQGNDIRLMTDEIAETLGRLRINNQLSGDRFTKPRWLHFAWDLPSNDARSDEVVAGIKLLYAHGFTAGELRFYVLIGFPGYKVEDELHRITTLHGLGIEPYVMVYRDYSEHNNRDALHMSIQSWNNGHAHRKCTFAEFSQALTNGRQAERQHAIPIPFLDESGQPWSDAGASLAG